jgi:hypothetical protein
MGRKPRKKIIYLPGTPRSLVQTFGTQDEFCTAVEVGQRLEFLTRMTHLHLVQFGWEEATSEQEHQKYFDSMHGRWTLLHCVLPSATENTGYFPLVS